MPNFARKSQTWFVLHLEASEDVVPSTKSESSAACFDQQSGVTRLAFDWKSSKSDGFIIIKELLGWFSSLFLSGWSDSVPFSFVTDS